MSYLLFLSFPTKKEDVFAAPSSTARLSSGLVGVLIVVMKWGHLRTTALQPVLLTHPPHPPPPPQHQSRSQEASCCGYLPSQPQGELQKLSVASTPIPLSRRAVGAHGSVRVQEGLAAGVLAGNPFRNKSRCPPHSRGASYQTAGDLSSVSFRKSRAAS